MREKHSTGVTWAEGAYKILGTDTGVTYTYREEEYHRARRGPEGRGYQEELWACRLGGNTTKKGNSESGSSKEKKERKDARKEVCQGTGLTTYKKGNMGLKGYEE